MEEFNSKIVSSLTEGVIVSNTDGKIIYANKSAHKLFGYSDNQLNDLIIERLIPNELRKNHIKSRDDYMKAPVNRPHGIGIDVYGLKQNGSTFPVEISLSFIKHNSETLAIALISDITNRKRKEVKAQNYIKEQQEIKNKYINTQLQILKKQISPHYLFNCLSILYSFIKKDKEKASVFCKKISETYGYVLETKNQTLIDVKNEIDFVKNYIFLQKIRFPNCFEITFDDKLVENNILIVPLALQLLVENAFKHNVISIEQPLVIEIKLLHNHVCVMNNITTKPKITHSYGLGLKNLKEQYALISRTDVKITNDQNCFTVCIPAIKQN